MQRSNGKRLIGVAGVVAMAAAFGVAGAGTASAHDGKHHQQDCGSIHVEHSLDGGQTWTTDGRMDGKTVPVTVTVRVAPGEDVKKDCSYPVSLASYSAEGPTWETSGTQAFLGWDTTTLDSSHKQATLDVSQYAPTCFGQIDLYNNGTKYDGTGGPLPHFDDSRTPYNLITAWNGGSASDCNTPTPVPSDTTTAPTPVPSDSTTPAPTPTDSTTATPTPTDSTTGTPTPVVSDTSSPSPTPSDTSSAPGVPSASPSSSTPPASTSTAPPTGTSVVQPASSDSSSSGNLAETGGNSSQNTVFAAGGAALLLVGGGAVFFTRRRKQAGRG